MLDQDPELKEYYIAVATMVGGVVLALAVGWFLSDRVDKELHEGWRIIREFLILNGVKGL